MESLDVLAWRGPGLDRMTTLGWIVSISASTQHWYPYVAHPTRLGRATWLSLMVVVSAGELKSAIGLGIESCLVS